MWDVRLRPSDRPKPIRESYVSGDEFLIDFVAAVKSLTTNFLTKISSATPSSQKSIKKFMLPFSVTESRLWGNISLPGSLRTPLTGFQPSSSDQISYIKGDDNYGYCT